jgi:hypothetical protein
MGKPPFLTPHQVQQDDLLEIVEEPYVKSAEESKFRRERGYAVVRLIRTGDLFTAGFNATTWDRLLDAWGEDAKMWVGKRFKVMLETQTIRGEQKQVMFGKPYHDPQAPLKLEDALGHDASRPSVGD